MDIEIDEQTYMDKSSVAYVLKSSNIIKT